AGAAGAGIEEAAQRALATIVRLMPGRLAHRVSGFDAATAGGSSPSLRDAADPAVLMRVGDAIRSSEELRFDYRSADEDAAAGDADVRPVRRVQPHHLVLLGGRWYLLAFVEDVDDWRVYRVDRIEPRSHNGRRFASRALPGGDPVRYLSARFRGSDAEDRWPVHGEAVLQLPAAAAAPYVGDGVVEALDGEACRVRMGSWSWPGLAASFARFDAELREVQPRELREAFRVLAGRAARAVDGAAR
ncbi:MAG TPA: WYL domain-containing protein, partial [Naasia sp.]